MVKEVIDFLIQHDPEVGNAVKAEYDRQRRNIELIASENFVSEATLAAASTVLTNKYAERLASVTMAAVSAGTWWKIWPVTGQRPSLGLTTPMSSPTAALLPTTQSIRPCVTWVTPSWA